MNKKVIIIVLAAVLILVGVFYFIPRLVLMSKINKLDIEILDLDLDSKYLGESKEIYQKGIKISLPISNNKSEEFIFEDDEDSPLRVKGNGYTVIIRRKSGEGIYNNIELNDEVASNFNGATTMNEYYIENLSQYNNKLGIFSAIKDLNKNFEIGDDVDLAYGIYGNIYSIIEKDNFIFVIILNDSYTKKGDYHYMHICAYDIDKSYEYSADIDIMRFPDENNHSYMNLEEISFIIQSLVVEDY